MLDPRKPRKFDPKSLSVLVVDSNRFNRNLLSDILRVIGVQKVSTARNAEAVYWALDDKPIDVIIGDWSPVNEIDVAKFARNLRALTDDRIRRLPVIAVISETTREIVITGRDAGIDEFLAKPISPNALETRMSMVIKTPRPFVDSKVYVGPCRRRKNPADYYGPKRRGADAREAAPEPEEVFANDGPVSQAVSKVRAACQLVKIKGQEALPNFQLAVEKACRTAADNDDAPVEQALKALGVYTITSLRNGDMDEQIIETGLSTLSQLTVLPTEMTSPRKTIAGAFRVAIKKKLAA